MTTFEEFRDARRKREKERYELFQWIKEKEQEYNIEKVVPLDFNTIPLYRDATNAFIFEQFLASILVIGTTIEQYLLWKVEKGSKLKERIYRKGFYPRIKQILSQELSMELKQFFDHCRDEVAHPKTKNHFLALGLPYNIEEGYFGGSKVEPIILHTKDNQLVNIGYECAKRGLELFMKIVNYVESNKTKI